MDEEDTIHVTSDDDLEVIKKWEEGWTLKLTVQVN